MQWGENKTKDERERERDLEIKEEIKWYTGGYTRSPRIYLAQPSSSDNHRSRLLVKICTEWVWSFWVHALVYGSVRERIGCTMLSCLYL